MKKIILLMLLCTLFLTGCGVKPKEFKGGGVTITLTNEFKEYQTEKWDYYLEDDNIAFMTKRVNRNSTIGEVSLTKFKLADYMAYLLAGNNLNVAKHKVDGANGPFIYSYYSSYKDYNDNYVYMLMVMEGKEHFYSMNFCCNYDDFEIYKQTFLTYAMTIKVR